MSSPTSVIAVLANRLDDASQRTSPRPSPRSLVEPHMIFWNAPGTWFGRRRRDYTVSPITSTRLSHSLQWLVEASWGCR